MIFGLLFTLGPVLTIRSFPGPGTDLSLGAITLLRDREHASRPVLESKAPESLLVRFEQEWKRTPSKKTGVNPQGADVVVLEFNDFLCPLCRKIAPEIENLLRRLSLSHPGLVRFERRDFPLDTECNRNLRQSKHELACEVAVAVRIAEEAGQGGGFAKEMYARQGDLTLQIVKARLNYVAPNSGYEARYQSTLALVRRDVEDGIALGVPGTPTFFVNGKMIGGALPVNLLEHGIKMELADAAASRAPKAVAGR